MMLAGRPADHALGLGADGQHALGLGVDGDHRRLADDDAAVADVDQRVGGPEVDADVAGEEAEQAVEHGAERVLVGRGVVAGGTAGPGSGPGHAGVSSGSGRGVSPWQAEAVYPRVRFGPAEHPAAGYRGGHPHGYPCTPDGGRPDDRCEPHGAHPGRCPDVAGRGRARRPVPRGRRRSGSRSGRTSSCSRWRRSWPTFGLFQDSRRRSSARWSSRRSAGRSWPSAGRWSPVAPLADHQPPAGPAVGRLGRGDRLRRVARHAGPAHPHPGARCPDRAGPARPGRGPRGRGGRRLCRGPPDGLRRPARRRDRGLARPAVARPSGYAWSWAATTTRPGPCCCSRRTSRRSSWSAASSSRWPAPGRTRPGERSPAAAGRVRGGARRAGPHRPPARVGRASSPSRPRRPRSRARPSSSRGSASAILEVTDYDDRGRPDPALPRRLVRPDRRAGARRPAGSDARPHGRPHGRMGPTDPGAGGGPGLIVPRPAPGPARSKTTPRSRSET